MRLIFAVVQRGDLPELLKALTGAGFRVTVIRSRGGFLRIGSVTVMIGADGSLVPEVFAIIKRICRHRVRPSLPMVTTIEPGIMTMPYPVEVEVGGAVCFTLKVARFVRIQGQSAR
ncbi:MAG: cyclic-di-AMP receptor [Chloroflexota bacterium]|nr:cyclic-di-AMP receptor [Chloroflexota bacterium]